MTEIIRGLEAVFPPSDEVIQVIAENDDRVLVQVTHNSIYADPVSPCNSLVVCEIDKRQRGNLGAFCSSQHPVELNATQILITLDTLKFPPRTITRESIQLLAKETGLSERVLSAWGKPFGGDIERLQNFARAKRDRNL